MKLQILSFFILKNILKVTHFKKIASDNHYCAIVWSWNIPLYVRIQFRTRQMFIYQGLYNKALTISYVSTHRLHFVAYHLEI